MWVTVKGSIIGVIQGDTRNLDYSSYDSSRSQILGIVVTRVPVQVNLVFIT